MSASKPSCPVELTLDILGGKWKTVILAHLKERALRYRDLRELIPELSDKMLTQRLRDLETGGLIRKSAGNMATQPYELTDQGRSLSSVLQALYDWGAARFPLSDVRANRVPAGA